MSWRCPACATPIRLSGDEARPRLGTTYRCHVCRVELVLDPRSNTLTVTSPRGDDGGSTGKST